MTLVIEDGSGVAGAEAYATAAAFDAWAVAVHGAAVAGTEAAKESAIRRAVAYLNGLSWRGVKTHGRAQPLAWPRACVTDRDGWAVDSGSIPPEVIEAQHMLARQEVLSPGSLAPTVTPASQKTLVEAGPLKWQADTPRGVGDQRANVSAAMDRLQGLVLGGGGSTVVVRA